MCVFNLFLHVTPKLQNSVIGVVRLSVAHSDLISTGHTFTAKWLDIALYTKPYCLEHK